MDGCIYLFLFMCMYIYVYIHIQIYIYIYKYIYKNMYIKIYVIQKQQLVYIKNGMLIRKINMEPSKRGSLDSTEKKVFINFIVYLYCYDCIFIHVYTYVCIYQHVYMYASFDMVSSKSNSYGSI
jgi:hypothetical protein